MGSKDKNRKHRKRARLQSELHEKSLNNPPRSLVIGRGRLGQQVPRLIKDFRQVMSPFTAKNFRESKSNTIQDFVKFAGQFSVTHFMIFSQTNTGTHLKLARIPRGPSLFFKVNNFTTMESIRKHQKDPSGTGAIYNHAPLVVLNNFSGQEDHKKIMTAVFQNMFPGIDITNMRLADCRRVVLLNYNSEDDTIDFRHYSVNAQPVGLSKGVRKVIKGKIVDLHNREDIADYVDNPNTLSDSEADVPEDAKVTLSQNLRGRGNLKSHTSAIKLKELGPRMNLQLTKIVEGLLDGQVLYHRFITKSEEEVQALAERKATERAEKEERKAQQEANVLKKQQLLDEKAKQKEERKAANEAARAVMDHNEDGDDEDEDEDDEIEEDGVEGDDEDEEVGDEDEDEDEGEFVFDMDEDAEEDEDEEEEQEESEESEDEPIPPPKKKKNK